jgi:hypothetical protein
MRFIIPTNYKTANRSGIALIMAIGAMVVLGLMITSAHFGAGIRHRIGRVALLQARAQSAILQVETTSLDDAASQKPDSLAVGHFAQPVNHSVGGVESATTRIARVSQNVYMLLTEVTVASPPRGTVRRRSAMYFRVDSADGQLSAKKVTARPHVEIF